VFADIGAHQPADVRDLVAEWHSHLLDCIIARSQKHDQLVVEGYLLFDCKDDYEKALTKGSTQVFQIQAKNNLYSSIRGLLTIEQMIASLGLPKK